MHDNVNLPAFQGGKPAKQTPWRRETRYGEEELAELNEAISQGTLFYAFGSKVRQLEEEFARKYGVDFAVACSSGTSAIHAAMIATGISPGDEVIVSPITDMGSIAPILFQGAVPIFADLHPKSYVINPESVEALITPKTRAVLAVHLWGNACDMDALRQICDRHNLILIEDCAQAFGCTYKGLPIGTLGDVGCFSFNEFKHISCGDGGIAITKNNEIARKLRLATDKCYSREAGAAIRNPIFLANNYRMTELQGAVATAQLRKLDSIIERRRKWCELLMKRLAGLPGIQLPEITPGCNPSWWFFMMRIDSSKLGVTADQFAQALDSEGIPARPHYIGQCIYEYPIFAQHSAFERGWHPYKDYEYSKGMCKAAEEIIDSCIVININEAYTKADLEETVLGIEKVAKWFNASM